MKELLLSIVSNLNEGELLYQWAYEMMESMQIDSKQSIIDAISASTSIERINRESLIGSFSDELASWAQDCDGLFLVDDNLLICLAEDDAKLIA